MRAWELLVWIGLFLILPDIARADPISAIVTAAVWFFTSTSFWAIAARFVVAFAINALRRPSSRANAAERQASILTLSVGEHPREVIFGRACTGGSLAGTPFAYGGSYDNDWNVFPIAVADHLCDALEGFYVDDQSYDFPEAWQAGGGGLIAGFNDQLEIWFRPGTLDQDGLPAHLITASAGKYTADDTWAGVAMVFVAYKGDAQDARNPVWAGRPRFRWVLRGKRCYDPRLDSTVDGGDGPHRWDDPSTWTWSENVIVCEYNYRRGIYAGDLVDQPEMLLIGRGLSAIEAPPEDIIAGANVCDEAVALKAGGTEPRYRCGGVIQATEDFKTVTDMFASACGGYIRQPAGSILIEPGVAKASVQTITDRDLVTGSRATARPFATKPQRVHTVIPRYIEPQMGWQQHAAPLRRSPAAIALDGGGAGEASLDLPLVTSGTQAQRLGEIQRRRARLERRFSATLPPRYRFLEEGDWIDWESPRRWGEEVPTFEIVSWGRNEKRETAFELVETSAAVFDWDPEDDEITPGTVPETPADRPGPLELTVESITLVQIPGQGGQSTPAVRFEWDTPVDLGFAGVRGEVRWYDGFIPDVDGDPIPLADGLPWQGVDDQMGETAPTTTNDPDRGAIIATNGVLPGLPLAARLVPVALERGRGVEPSPWVLVGIGDTITTPGGGEGTTWGQDSTVNNGTAGATHVAIAQVALTGVGASPLLEAEIAIVQVPLTSLTSGAVFNGGWELVETSGATTNVLETGTWTATDTGGGLIDIAGDWPGARFEVGAGGLFGDVTYALRVWRTSGANDVLDFSATLFIRRS